MWLNNFSHGIRARIDSSINMAEPAILKELGVEDLYGFLGVDSTASEKAVSSKEAIFISYYIMRVL